MSWRLRIRHTSGYRYDAPVRASFNEARITPLTTHTQTTVDSRVAVSPEASTYRYWDYWGTLVHAFDLHSPHTSLVVTGTSVVETGPPPEAPVVHTWEDAMASAADYTEFLAATGHVPAAPVFEATAGSLVAAGTPLDAARAASAWVREALGYQPGTTGVSTSATEALAAGQGVCQDFVHVFLGLVRAMGIPGRYVSGYLHPSADPQLGVGVQGQSHAWAEVWVGQWVAIDPTNGTDPGLRHVIVGRGRDYRDVSPLRGIYSGGSGHALEVEVELTRIG